MFVFSFIILKHSQSQQPSQLHAIRVLTINMDSKTSRRSRFKNIAKYDVWYASVLGPCWL